MPKEETIRTEDEVLTKREAAAFLKMSEPTLTYLIKTNQVPYSRTGRRNVRFYRPLLIQWLKDRAGVELRHAKAERK